MLAEITADWILRNCLDAVQIIGLLAILISDDDHAASYGEKVRPQPGPIRHSNLPPGRAAVARLCARIGRRRPCGARTSDQP